jgi:hypothetical protein
LHQQDFAVSKNRRSHVNLWGGVPGLGLKYGPDLGPINISLPGKDLRRDLGYALVTLAVVV